MQQLNKCLRLLVLLLVCGSAYAESFGISAEDWLPPRSGERVRDLPAVSSAVAVLRGNDAARLRIFHRPDEEGALWGAELHDWLVSLGIPPARIQVVTADDLSTEALRLEVQRPGSQVQP